MIISYTLIISKFPLKKLFIISSVFILYNLILVLFNDDVFTPLVNFVRVSLPIMFIFLAYVYINNANKLVMLFKSIIIGIFIYSVNYIIANYFGLRSEEHTSELQSRGHLVCRLLLEKKKTQHTA